MNSIDIFLILVILFATYRGWNTGFIAGISDVIGWMGSLFVGFLIYPHIATLIEKYVTTLGVLSVALSFIVSIIIARVVVGLVINRLFQAVPYKVHGRLINKVLGVFPGFLNGVVYAALITTLFLLVPFPKAVLARSQESELASNLTRKVAWLETKISPVLNRAGKLTVNKLTVVPDSQKLVKLPYTVKSPKTRPDLEILMLDMVNIERRKKGLKSLTGDPELTKVARSHSEDMFKRGYFSHLTLEGKDPFDRMRSAKVDFLTAGENLALAQSLAMAHTGLMNSPGHRANILHRGFGRLGIGILDGGIYGIMVTQNFRN